MSPAPNEQAWTVLRLLDWTREYFARQQIDSPRLAAEMLLAHVLACPRVQLYARFDRCPSPRDLTTYRDLVRRAVAHEPVAYLVGHREFYSLDFIVTPDVLIPRPETELLVDQAVEFLRSRGPSPRCWDACTGSGAVAVAVAKQAPDAAVLATDISASALAVAGQNVEKHALAERVDLAKADLLTLPAGLVDQAPFDVVTANPPYISITQMAELPADVLQEPAAALAAGADGLDCIRPILNQAPDVLVEGGLLAMEIGFGQAEAVWGLYNQVGRYERGEFVRDGAGLERVLVAHRSK